jgi:1,3-beta-glucanosyltransferase GAS1
MYSKTITTAALVAGLAVNAVSAALSQITVKGSKFFTADGNQFFIKGSNSPVTTSTQL